MLGLWVHDWGAASQLPHFLVLRQPLPELPPASRRGVLRLKVDDGACVFGDTPVLILDRHLGFTNNNSRMIRELLNQRQPASQPSEEPQRPHKTVTCTRVLVQYHTVCWGGLTGTGAGISSLSAGEAAPEHLATYVRGQ